MRHELGLDLPERRIGLSAHDFAQLLGAEDVILSHSAKVGGAPAVASRFLHRLEAVAGEERWKAAKAAGDRYVRFADELDRPPRSNRSPQPAAKPPRADAAAKTVGDRDRGLAARSLHDLRPAHPEARSARSRRHAAVGRRSRLGDPRCARRIHQGLRQRAARRSGARLARHRRKILRAADGASRGARAVVATLPAHRAMVCGMGDRAARQYPGHRRRDPGRNRNSARQRAHLHPRRRAPTGSSAAATAVLPSSTTRPGSRRPASRCGWDCRRS